MSTRCGNGYSGADSNVNYIQSRRDVQYYPSSLSTFTPGLLEFR